jgi:allophanate hydrolase subunit 1
MWDFDNRGFPHAPVGVAMASLGLILPSPPHRDNARRDRMQALWEQAGLTAIATEVIHIDVAYASFEDFWQSSTAPVGPSGKAIADLSPQDRERLKTRLREQVPTASDGRIAYRSCANAVKGIKRSPG